MLKNSLRKVPILALTFASLSLIFLPIGLTQPKQTDFVSPEDFGASSDGIKDDTQSVQTALNTGKNVRLSKIYSVSTIYTTAPNQKIFGGGTIVSRSGKNILLELRQVENVVDDVKFDTTKQQPIYAIQAVAKNSQVKNSTFRGNIGHYIVTNAEADGISITKNSFDGTNYNQVTPVVINGADDFIVADNSFINVTGFNLQTRWASNGKIERNTFQNPTYTSSKVASPGQEVFEMEFSAKVNRIGLRIDGKVTPRIEGPIRGGRYFNIISKDSKRFTVTLLDANKNAYKLKGGEKVEIIGWRSLENININAGSKNLDISNNIIEGSGDGGIVISSDYNKNKSLDPSNPADIPTNIRVTNNEIRNINAEGIGVIYKSNGIVISGNKISDCGQGIGGHFSSCIFAADNNVTLSNNSCSNSSTGITLFKTFFANAPQKSEKI